MPGGKTFTAKASTPIGEAGTISGGIAAASPAFNMGTPLLTFGSPAITLTSPNATGVGTSVANGMGFMGFDGGVGMGITLSNLGISMGAPAMLATASATGKADDAERRRRLKTVLNTLGTRSGRISRDGIERLGRKCGLDIQAGDAELAMAGKNVMVDVSSPIGVLGMF